MKGAVITRTERNSSLERTERNASLSRTERNWSIDAICPDVPRTFLALQDNNLVLTQTDDFIIVGGV